MDDNFTPDPKIQNQQRSHYQWLGNQSVRRATRRAALAPDEEPDEDMMTASERRERKDRQAEEAQAGWAYWNYGLE